MKKDRKTALLFCAFTGVVGGHKYYEGKIKEGRTYSILAGIALGGYLIPPLILLIISLIPPLFALVLMLPPIVMDIFLALKYAWAVLAVIFALALVIQTIYDFREIWKKKPEYTV